MARIKVEDLPLCRDLRPAEALELFGAGPKRFRPRFEALEDRRLMSASALTDLAAQVAPLTAPTSPTASQVQAEHTAPALVPAQAAQQQAPPIDLSPVQQTMSGDLLFMQPDQLLRPSAIPAPPNPFPDAALQSTGVAPLVAGQGAVEAGEIHAAGLEPSATAAIGVLDDSRSMGPRGGPSASDASTTQAVDLVARLTEIKQVLERYISTTQTGLQSAGISQSTDRFTATGEVAPAGEKPIQAAVQRMTTTAGAYTVAQAYAPPSQAIVTTPTPQPVVSVGSASAPSGQAIVATETLQPSAGISQSAVGQAAADEVAHADEKTIQGSLQAETAQQAAAVAPAASAPASQAILTTPTPQPVFSGIWASGPPDSAILATEAPQQLLYGLRADQMALLAAFNLKTDDPQALLAAINKLLAPVVPETQSVSTANDLAVMPKDEDGLSAVPSWFPMGGTSTQVGTELATVPASPNPAPLPSTNTAVRAVESAHHLLTEKATKDPAYAKLLEKYGSFTATVPNSDLQAVELMAQAPAYLRIPPDAALTYALRAYPFEQLATQLGDKSFPNGNLAPGYFAGPSTEQLQAALRKIFNVSTGQVMIPAGNQRENFLRAYGVQDASMLAWARVSDMAWDTNPPKIDRPPMTKAQWQKARDEFDKGWSKWLAAQQELKVVRQQIADNEHKRSELEKVFWYAPEFADRNRAYLDLKQARFPVPTLGFQLPGSRRTLSALPCQGSWVALPYVSRHDTHFFLRGRSWSQHGSAHPDADFN